MRNLLYALGGVAVVTIGAWIVYDQGVRRPIPDGLVQTNGRIEGDNITVASKFAGRVAELHVHEGDEVKTGQELVHLDDRQVSAKVEQARQAMASIEAEIKALETSLELLRQQVPLEIADAQASLENAIAIQANAISNEDQAKREAIRSHELYETKAVDQQTDERSQLAWKIAQNHLSAAKTATVQAQTHLTLAKLGGERIRSKEDELAATRAKLAEAKAAVVEAESIQGDLEIRAPADGVITTRFVDIGEVVGAGAPLLDLVNLDRLYLKVYVPELQIGKVRRGLKARIYSDAYPDDPTTATVQYISSRAEFTPKEVQTPDERVKLVYAVKLYLDENPKHKFSPGLPADAVIRWKDDVPWTKPRW